MTCFRFSWILLVISSTCLAHDYAGRYFMMAWGQNGPRDRPRVSHTFSIYIDGSNLREGERLVMDRLHTLSWLPCDARIRPFIGEPGCNFDLANTYRNGRAIGGQFAPAWGPFEITSQFYHEATQQIARLSRPNPGVQYKMLDVDFFPNSMNCISAHLQLVGHGHRQRSWGDLATGQVVHEFNARGKIVRDAQNRMVVHPDVVNYVDLPQGLERLRVR